MIVIIHGHKPQQLRRTIIIIIIRPAFLEEKIVDFGTEVVQKQTHIHTKL